MSTNIRWFDENKNERNTTVAVPSDIPTIPTINKINYKTYRISIASSGGTVSFVQGTSTDFRNDLSTYKTRNHFSLTLKQYLTVGGGNRFNLACVVGLVLTFVAADSSIGLTPITWLLAMNLITTEYSISGTYDVIFEYSDT